jgi:bis(5'-nucleosyl)-tetraphosphatase (symmetrical)
MATYLIGDVHGCFETLSRLLEEFGYNPKNDRIYLTGDLVNGGPASAAVLRWAKRHEASAVLGNHDLHLLAVAAGARAPRKNDTFLDLLEAEDGEELISWLRNRPLVIREKEFLLVHAGVLPEWDTATTLRLAGEAEALLRSPPDRTFFREMYGDEPSQWSETLTGMDRIRVIINAMTRLRTLTPENGIDAEHKGPPEEAPAENRPWFSVEGRATSGDQIFFGHWAALGFYEGEKTVGLDSGCAWGGKLSAWRLEDGRLFQVVSELSDEALALNRK